MKHLKISLIHQIIPLVSLTAIKQMQIDVQNCIQWPTKARYITGIIYLRVNDTASSQLFDKPPLSHGKESSNAQPSQRFISHQSALKAAK